MSALWLSACLLLLLMSSVLCQRQGPDELLVEWHRDIDVLNRNRVLLPPAQKSRSPQPRPLAPKRSPQGSRFSLSLDVPTSILSVLIDLAKNHEMHAKAAANAQLMARVGKRGVGAEGHGAGYRL